jgi:hypothetical protein
MKVTGSRAVHPLVLCGGMVLAATISGIAQQPPTAPGGQGGRGGGRGGVAPALFGAADTNKDGSLSRDELKGTFDKWYTAADPANAGSVTPAQLASAVTAALPPPPPTAPAAAQGEPCGGRSSNPDDDDHLQPGRHQRREPEAVRRALPRQHDRMLPRRSGRQGGD